MRRTRSTVRPPSYEDSALAVRPALDGHHRLVAEPAEGDPAGPRRR
ncbi:hypothetical protein ACWD7C_29770 [Streptomyces sp. NPDC005134]